MMLKRLRNSHLWERDPLDWYVEPEWVSQRLFDVEPFHGFIVDPWSGLGRIYQSARRAGHQAVAFDIVSRFKDCHVRDFADPVPSHTFSNIVGNPPFGRAEEFTRLALDRVQCKCALLLPTIWLQGQKRASWLSRTPLYRVYFLCPRPSMPPGAVIEAGERPGGGRVDFAWFIWVKGYQGPAMIDWLQKEKADG